MLKKDKTRTCNLSLTDSIVNKIDVLKDKLNCSSRSELVRYLIEEIYKSKIGGSNDDAIPTDNNK